MNTSNKIGRGPIHHLSKWKTKLTYLILMSLPASPSNIILLLSQGFRVSGPHPPLPSIQTCSRACLDPRFQTTCLLLVVSVLWNLALFRDPKLFCLLWGVIKASSRHRVTSRTLTSLQGRLAPTQMTSSPLREGGAVWYRQVSGSGKLRQAGGSQEKQRTSEMCLPAVENKNGIFFFLLDGSYLFHWKSQCNSSERSHILKPLFTTGWW